MATRLADMLLRWRMEDALEDVPEHIRYLVWTGPEPRPNTDAAAIAPPRP